MSVRRREPVVVSLTDPAVGREIVPGVAHMRHMFGEAISVALFKIARGKGGAFPRVFHAHGEEFAVQLKGTARLWACGKEYVVREGEAIYVPAGLEHAGIFGDEEAVLLAVATPPRNDYGPETWLPVVPARASN